MLSKEERRYLKIAKQMIAKGIDHHICMALRRQSVNGTKRLRQYIAKKLGGDDVTLTNWQYWQGIERTYAQRKQDRLDWIDWMLGVK